MSQTRLGYAIQCVENGAYIVIDNYSGPMGCPGYPMTVNNFENLTHARFFDDIPEANKLIEQLQSKSWNMYGLPKNAHLCIYKIVEVSIITTEVSNG